MATVARLSTAAPAPSLSGEGRSRRASRVKPPPPVRLSQNVDGPSPSGCLQRLDVTTGGAGAREQRYSAPAPVALARSLAALAARSPRRPKVRAAQQLRGRVRPLSTHRSRILSSPSRPSCCRRPLPALASLPPTRSAECSAGGGAEAIGDTLPKRAVALLASAVVAWSSLLSPLEASALDTAKVGSCLLENCQSQLAACIADEKCAESLVCLNRCNGTKDEAACQVRASPAACGRAGC